LTIPDLIDGGSVVLPGFTVNGRKNDYMLVEISTIEICG